MLPLPRRLFNVLAAIGALSIVVSLSPLLSGAGGKVLAATGSSTAIPRWIALNGSVAPLARLAQRVRPLAATRQLTVTVSLRVRNQAALTRFLSDVYNPSSSDYRQFLTPEQFAQRFGPTQDIVAQTTSWLRGQGLTISGASANGLQLSARGTVAQLTKAFNAPLYQMRAHGRVFFANSSPLQIPGSLAPDVLDVAGLSSATPAQTPETVRPRQPAQGGFTPSDIAGIYDTAPLLAQGLNGSGQTIAVATFADYVPNNISVFDQRYGLSGNVTRINVDGGGLLGYRNGEDETEADIEMVQGTAPGASILVYEAPNSTTNQTMIDLYNKIVSDNRASIITTSWGGAESTYSDSDLATIDQILQEAAAQGQAFFAASGDNGAYDNAGNGPGSDTQLAVDYPASDPWVTGVGGTTLTASGAHYGSESAWSDSSQRPAEGSGGGLSQTFARPSYQNGPGVENQYSNGKRQVPDVAADADVNTGYSTYLIGSRNSPGWGVGGGTSASAPLWAAFDAIVNQALGLRIGFLNPLLYELGQKASTFAVSPFHDVTTGDNLYYPATAGWDFATGWGSFDGAAFVADARTVPIPTVVPTSTPTAAPSPTPKPTSTAVTPAVSITKFILLHTVNGKLQPTTTLKLGEKGTVMVLYHVTNGGALKPGGTVVIRFNGQSISTVTLRATTYQGKPALTTTVHFTNKKRVGTLKAHITVTLGSVAAVVDRTFKLGA